MGKSTQLECNNKRQTKFKTEEEASKCYTESLPSGSTEPHGSKNRCGSARVTARHNGLSSATRL